jgi:hypothetical protein
MRIKSSEQWHNTEYDDEWKFKSCRRRRCVTEGKWVVQNQRKSQTTATRYIWATKNGASFNPENKKREKYSLKKKGFKFLGGSRRNSTRCQVGDERQERNIEGGVLPTTFPDSIQLEAWAQDPLNSSNQFPTCHHSKSLNPFSLKTKQKKKNTKSHKKGTRKIFSFSLDCRLTQVRQFARPLPNYSLVTLVVCVCTWD